MKCAFMTCFVGLVGLMLPPTRAAARISAPAKVESEIRALEVRRFRAMMDADTRTLDLLLGDDLTYVHSEGWCQTKVEFIAGIRSGDLRYYDVKTEDVMVHVYGETAVVTGRATVRVKSGSGPKSFKLRYVDVYVKRGGHWQMVAWQSTEVAQYGAGGWKWCQGVEMVSGGGNGVRNHFIIEEKAIGCGYGENGARNGS